MLHVLLGFCTLAISAVAHAYVPPSFFVVRSIARKHSMVDEGRFRHKITFYKNGNEVIRSFNETVILTNADSAIVQISDEKGNTVVSRSRKLMGSKLDEINRPVSYDLLMMKDFGQVFSHFRSLGLPIKAESDLYSEKEGSLPYKPEDTVAYSRYDRRVAIVISDATKKIASDVRTPQLWAEKDSFLPLRAVFPSPPETGISSEPLEYRFSTYQIYKGLLYPQTMQVFRKGELWAKVETQDVQLSAGQKPDAQNNLDLAGDAKDALEIYLKWVR